MGQPASILRFGVPLRASSVLVLVCLFLGVWLQAQEKESPKRLDLNTATADELDTLPEVGPKLAKAIVQFREKSGPFRRVEDLLAVPGISKRRLEKIRPRVFVGTQKSGPRTQTQNSEQTTPEILRPPRRTQDDNANRATYDVRLSTFNIQLEPRTSISNLIPRAREVSARQFSV